MKTDSRHVVLAALQNAYIYLWPQNGTWEGMVVFRKDKTPLQFHADDEESAKTEGLRLAGHTEALWKSSRLPFRMAAGEVQS